MPGATSEELAGKSSLDINRLRLAAEKARSVNIMRPYALFHIVYGLTRLATANPVYGAYHVLYGAGEAAAPQLLRDGAFQEWVLKQAGVAPNSTTAAGLRNGLADLATAMSARKGLTNLGKGYGQAVKATAPASTRESVAKLLTKKPSTKPTGK